jgi:hypothetical protein
VTAEHKRSGVYWELVGVPGTFFINGSKRMTMGNAWEDME